MDPRPENGETEEGDVALAEVEQEHEMEHVEKLKVYRSNCVEEMNRRCRDLAQLAPEMFSACALLALALVILVLNARHGLEPIPVLLLLIAVYLVFSSVFGAMWLLFQWRSSPWEGHAALEKSVRSFRLFEYM